MVLSAIQWRCCLFILTLSLTGLCRSDEPGLPDQNNILFSTQNKYFEWESPRRPLAVCLATDTFPVISSLAQQLRDMGTNPVSVASHPTLRDRYQLMIGRFESMLEADSYMHHLRKTGHGDAFVRGINASMVAAATNGLTLPETSAPLRLPISGFVEPDATHYSEMSVALGTTISTEMELAEYLSARHSPAGILSKLDKLDRGNPLFLQAVLANCRVEMETAGTTVTLSSVRTDFLNGGLGCCAAQYYDLVLQFADFDHEFAHDPRNATLLYLGVARGIRDTPSVANKGQRARAYAELTALAMEQARRGVGKLTGVSYWKKEYKQSGLPQKSRAMAVIDLICAEAYWFDQGANLTVTDPSNKSYDLFRDFATAYHENYPTYYRERLFLINLVLGISAAREDWDAYESSAKQILSFPKLPDKEINRWRGQPKDFVCIILKDARTRLLAAKRVSAAANFEKSVSACGVQQFSRAVDYHKVLEEF